MRRKYGEQVLDVEMVDKEDLDLKNHLSGLQQTYLKVSFATTQELMDVRREILPIVSKNKKKSSAAAAYEALSHQESLDAGIKPKKKALTDYEEAMIDIREYDVPYHMRYMIDTDVRCGKWYSVRAEHGAVTLTLQEEMLDRGEVRVCAFDIETTKLPLKFPDAEHDQVFMISYMLDGQGYLIINREIVSEDVEDFEYTPKPEYQGPFIVWNEPNEASAHRDDGSITCARRNRAFTSRTTVITSISHSSKRERRRTGWTCTARSDSSANTSGECRSKFCAAPGLRSRG